MSCSQQLDLLLLRLSRLGFVSEEGSSQVDEKTKEEYEERARVDKERYLKEKAESVSKCLLFVLDENLGFSLKGVAGEG